MCMEGTVWNSLLGICEDAGESVCADYCENGGSCSIDEDGDPVCDCPPGFLGDQCCCEYFNVSVGC